jgi:hypothetical protein
MNAIAPYAPAEPASLAETGLADSMVEQLILKILYSRGDLYGKDLANAIGLRFSVIQDFVETFKLRHHIQVRRSMGMGDVGALLSLTESGRDRAREYLEANRYAGPAPVPLEQYAAAVRKQRPQQGWLTKGSLARAFSGMVITERVLSQVGPAISSANSLLLYGKPGDGKTFLIESLNNLDAPPIFLPYALECQGNIVQLYDPIYHRPVDEDGPLPMMAIARESAHDRRFARCKRPFIVSGGELSLDMLDLRYNETSRVYEAPFQLKANNGIYLIDDFGRQRATPAEVLNRWIVPMERHIDYLSFLTGGKMPAPFETFLVFSTNLDPANLGDEAFLRRIQYKMLLRGPSEKEFFRIFEDFCTAKNLPFPREVIARFVDKHYRQTGKPMRRCHPRDVLSHALNLMSFERLPVELNEETLDRAFESCFLEENQDEPVAETQFVHVPAKPCVQFWSEKLDAITTEFGKLAFIAARRECSTGAGPDADANLEYDAAESYRVILRLHTETFRRWLQLNLEQQSRDVLRYLSTTEGQSAYLNFGRRELVESLVPAEALPEELQLFHNDLTTVLLAISQKPQDVRTLSALIENVA